MEVKENVPSTEMIVVATLASVSTWKPRNAPTKTMPAQRAPAAHSAKRTPPTDRQAAMIAVTIVIAGRGENAMPAVQQPRMKASKSRLRISAALVSGETRAAAYASCDQMSPVKTIAVQSQKPFGVSQ